MVLLHPPHGGARLLALDGVVADVGVHLDLVDAGEHLGAVDQRRPEGQRVPHTRVQKRLGLGGGLVVDLHAPVAVEGHAVARSAVAVDDAVADEDAVAAEAVVVAVDGQDRVVLGGHRAGLGDDVGAVGVVGEGAAQVGGVGELDVGHVVGDGVAVRAGGDLLDLDARVGRGVGAVPDRHVRGRGRRGGGVLRLGLQSGDVADFHMVDDEAVERPGAGAGGGQAQDGGAPQEEAAARVLAGRRGAVAPAGVVVLAELGRLGRAEGVGAVHDSTVSAPCMPDVG